MHTSSPFAAPDSIVQKDAVVFVQPFPLGELQCLFGAQLHFWVLGISRDVAGAEQPGSQRKKNDGSRDQKHEDREYNFFHLAMVFHSGYKVTLHKRNLCSPSVFSTGFWAAALICST